MTIREDKDFMGKILIIEDNDDDVLMIKRGFKKGRIANNIFCVSNGKEGLDYLSEETAKTIDLILLDLNMEVMNGFDFLLEREKNVYIKKIPVVILTSSSRQNDIEKAYKFGANSYVEKPLEPDKFIEAMLSIEDFWILLAKKP